MTTALNPQQYCNFATGHCTGLVVDIGGLLVCTHHRVWDCARKDGKGFCPQSIS